MGIAYTRPFEDGEWAQYSLHHFPIRRLSGTFCIRAMQRLSSGVEQGLLGLSLPVFEYLES